MIVDILGIPVIMDPASTHVAYSWGLWSWKRIVVGPLWLDLPAGEQRAVLLHEAHHCHARHMEWRVLWCLLCWLPYIAEKARQQEFDADEFAAEQGFAMDFMRFLTRRRAPEGPFYPSHEERITRLFRWIGEHHEATA